MTPKLLDLHPFFDTREIDISDAAYAAKMIMILNAAHKCPSVGQFFPPFVSRHYSYLRDVYPKLVPQLSFMEVGSSLSSRDRLENETDHVTDSRPTIEYLLNRVKDIKSSPSGIKSGSFSKNFSNFGTFFGLPKWPKMAVAGIGQVDGYA